MKRIASITITSFTVSILAVCAVSLILNEYLPFFDVSFPPKLFSLCLLVALLMRGYEWLIVRSKLSFYISIDVIVRLTIVFLLTYGYGPLIGAYEIRNPIVFGVVAVIACGTFIITYLVSYRALLDDIDVINQQIETRRNRKHE